MPISLHTDKIKDEKNAFVQELYDTVLTRDALIDGDYSSQAVRLHKLYLSLYIMNHFKQKEFQSQYYEYLISCLIESESLFFIGLKNSAIMVLRSALELSFKFLYFEYHPIELKRNETGDFDLHAIEYREFLYTFPAFSEQQVIRRDFVERLWKELCQYTHCDLKTVDQISVISEIKPIFQEETSFRKCLAIIKDVLKIIVSILFLVDPSWLQKAEKSYFDYPFEILFDSRDVPELKVKFKIE